MATAKNDCVNEGKQKGNLVRSHLQNKKQSKFFRSDGVRGRDR